MRLYDFPASVMVVDDEKDQTFLFSLFLARFGFDSITFNDPLVALKHYGQYNKRYSLVLVDWKMPKIDGLGLARKIREHNSRVKIILITAYFIGDIFAKDEFKEVKIADVIQKPIGTYGIWATNKLALSKEEIDLLIATRWTNRLSEGNKLVQIP